VRGGGSSCSTEVTFSLLVQVIRASTQLDRLLNDAGSAYQVHWSPTPVMIVRRVDPTAAAALEHARTNRSRARRAAAGPGGAPGPPPRPGPDRQLRHRGPRSRTGDLPAHAARRPHRHLGKVLAHLRQGGHKWRFVLVDRDGTDTVALPASDRPRLSRRRDSIKGLTATSTLAPLLDRLGEQRSAR
jgi:hypothetical protein